MYQYRLERSSVEKDIGDLVDDKLAMTQQCVLLAKKANGSLECIKKNHGQKVKGGDPPPLLCSSEIISAVLCPFLDSAFQKRQGMLSDWRATKTINNLEHHPFKEGLKDLSMLNLKKRRLRGIILLMLINI